MWGRQRLRKEAMMGSQESVRKRRVRRNLKGIEGERGAEEK